MSVQGLILIEMVGSSASEVFASDGYFRERLSSRAGRKRSYANRSVMETVRRLEVREKGNKTLGKPQMCAKYARRISW